MAEGDRLNNFETEVPGQDLSAFRAKEGFCSTKQDVRADDVLHARFNLLTGMKAMLRVFAVRKKKNRALWGPYRC